MIKSFLRQAILSLKKKKPVGKLIKPKLVLGAGKAGKKGCLSAVRLIRKKCIAPKTKKTSHSSAMHY